MHDRPRPPEPDTPNIGRKRHYPALVELDGPPPPHSRRARVAMILGGFAGGAVSTAAVLIWAIP